MYTSSLKPQQLNIDGEQEPALMAPPYAFEVVGVKVLDRLMVSALSVYASSVSARVSTPIEKEKNR
jgi:hypothetical protein